MPSIPATKIEASLLSTVEKRKLPWCSSATCVAGIHANYATTAIESVDIVTSKIPRPNHRSIRG